MIWKLEAIDIAAPDPRRPNDPTGLWTYGCNTEVVVRAQSAHRAREIAAENAANEGAAAWLDAGLTSVEPVLDQGSEGLVVASNVGA
jgi:hypothetical protein